MTQIDGRIPRGSRLSAPLVSSTQMTCGLARYPSGSTEGLLGSTLALYKPDCGPYPASGAYYGSTEQAVNVTIIPKDETMSSIPRPSENARARLEIWDARYELEDFSASVGGRPRRRHDTNSPRCPRTPAQEPVDLVTACTVTSSTLPSGNELRVHGVGLGWSLNSESTSFSQSTYFCRSSLTRSGRVNARSARSPMSLTRSNKNGAAPSASNFHEPCRTARCCLAPSKRQKSVRSC